MPDDGLQVLCKTPKVRGGEAAAPQRRKKEPADAEPQDGGECVMIGEQANGEKWYVCSEDAAVDGATCSEEEFGTGGGPGILPQDGEKLCKAPAPGAKTTFQGSSFHSSGKK